MLVIRRVEIEVCDHEETVVAPRAAKERRLQLSEVAAGAGISVSYLSQLENGMRPWTDSLSQAGRFHQLRS